MSAQVQRLTETTIEHSVTISSHIPPLMCVPPPSRGGEAAPVSVCCGSLSIQSKCCCYFLPGHTHLSGLYQGHTTSVLPSPPSGLPFKVT